MKRFTKFLEMVKKLINFGDLLEGLVTIKIPEFLNFLKQSNLRLAISFLLTVVISFSIAVSFSVLSGNQIGDSAGRDINKSDGDIIQPERDFNQPDRDVVYGSVFNFDDFQMILNNVDDIIQNTNTIVQTVESLEVEISESNQLEVSESNEVEISESNQLEVSESNDSEVSNFNLDVIRASSEEIIALSETVNRQLNEFSQSYRCQVSGTTAGNSGDPTSGSPSGSESNPADVTSLPRPIRSSISREDLDKRDATVRPESSSPEESSDCANVASNGSCYWLEQEGSELW